VNVEISPVEAGTSRDSYDFISDRVIAAIGINYAPPPPPPPLTLVNAGR
jgi:hypothetical protein